MLIKIIIMMFMIIIYTLTLRIINILMTKSSIILISFKRKTWKKVCFFFYFCLFWIFFFVLLFVFSFFFDILFVIWTSLMILTCGLVSWWRVLKKKKFMVSFNCLILIFIKFMFWSLLMKMITKRLSGFTFDFGIKKNSYQKNVST